MKRNGKKALWYPVCNLSRKLVLILTCVLLSDYPILSIFSVILQILFMIIAIGTSEPFTKKSDQNMALMNEFFCLVACYNLLTFSDWFPDGPARLTIGYSLISVTVLNIVLNLSIISIESISRVGRVAKLRWKQHKVFQAQKLKLEKVAIEKESAKKRQTDIDNQQK